MTNTAGHAKAYSRSGIKRVAILVLAVFTTALTTVAFAVIFTGKKFVDAYHGTVTTLPSAEVFPEENRPPAGPEGTQTILLLGSDTRATVDPDDIESVSGSRSDTMLLLQIPASREKIYGISFMRDSWVDIEGYGSAKLNAAMAFGGIPLAVSTLEGLVGTEIDHVALVDFEGFKAATDALGGVTINNPEAFSTRAAGPKFDFPAGKIELDGTEALAFVRERKAFIDGDYQRARNQQLFVQSMMKKMVSRSVLTNPNQLLKTVEAIGPHVVTDQDLDLTYLSGLLLSLTGMESDGFVTFTAPTAGIGTSADGQSIINLDPERMSALKQAFQSDSLDEYVATQDLQTY